MSPDVESLSQQSTCRTSARRAQLARGDDREERGGRRAGAAAGLCASKIGRRRAGIRPGDLVGAIVNEAGVSSGDLGAIQITDRFSLVEVPEAAADHVMKALRGTTLRGQKVQVRRDREA